MDLIRTEETVAQKVIGLTRRQQQIQSDDAYATGWNIQNLSSNLGEDGDLFLSDSTAPNSGGQQSLPSNRYALFPGVKAAGTST